MEIYPVETDPCLVQLSIKEQEDHDDDSVVETEISSSSTDSTTDSEITFDGVDPDVIAELEIS